MTQNRAEKRHNEGNEEAELASKYGNVPPKRGKRVVVMDGDQFKEPVGRTPEVHNNSNPFARFPGCGQLDEDEAGDVDTVYERVWGSFVQRPICPGRYINFESFAQNGCKFVLDWFHVLGWDSLMMTVKDIYPFLVRKFYAHFDVNDNEESVIRTMVEGVEIVLDEKVLGQILGIPPQGPYDFPGHKRSEIESFDRSECLNLLLKDECHGRIRKPDISELDMEIRLLHLVLKSTFIPRTGNSQSITYSDIFVMYFVLKHVKMNIVRFMIEYMLRAQKQKKLGLPYGMWLTLVFEHFGIDLSREFKIDVVTKNKQIGVVVDVRILKEAGYRLNGNGKWVKHGQCNKSLSKSLMQRGCQYDDDYDDVSNSNKSRMEMDTFDPTHKTCLVNILLVQEMLKHLNPAVFTDSLMKRLLGKAKSEYGRQMSNAIVTNLHSYKSSDEEDDE